MVDIFVDLSAFDAGSPEIQGLIARWARPESLGSIGRHIRVVVRPGKSSLDIALPKNWVVAGSRSPIPQLSVALEDAGRDKMDLLVLVGPVDITNEVANALRQCLARDPMFGFALPRVACTDRCCFARMSQYGVGVTTWLPRRILGELPPSQLMVQTASPCMLINADVAGNFGEADSRYDSIAAAMVHYMATARRCGFRTVVSNRLVVGVDGLACATDAVEPLPGLTRQDHVRLLEAIPDLQRSWDEFRSESLERFESVCAAATIASRRPSLLLDARNAGPMFNGTTQAVLGMMQAIRDLDPNMDVAVLGHHKGALVHDLAGAYPSWPVYIKAPEDRCFTMALRLSQPWHIQEMVDLHRASLINAYLLLDTISWDVVYASPPRLDGTWQFLADQADGLLFDSRFTADRFFERFPSAHKVPNAVTYFSLDPAEYKRSDLGNRTDEDYILVVGNSLDHKDVRQTVDALASAFPFRHIKALGPADQVSPFVVAVRSGELPEVDMHRLYAHAQFVVYPSFYEGFGFPVLTSLAYGRTVLARRSALLEEVAAQCDGRGRLIVFDRREELVELLGRLVHGEAVPEHPLGLGLAGRKTKTWRDVATATLEFLESIAGRTSPGRWLTREHVVQQLRSYRI